MRLDKFLKLSRIIKRRVVAKELSEAGAVRINGKIARPDSLVKKGDKLEVAFPRKVVTYEVIESDEALLKRRAVPCELIGERSVVSDEQPW